VHAPTGAARWFNKLDTELNTAQDTRIQTLDLSDMGNGSQYRWWIQKTSPAHPVLDDPRRQLYQDLGLHGNGPAQIVVDCHGETKFSHQGSIDQQSYDALKDAIKTALADKTCFPGQ
jgi:hypothetical protein